MSASSIDPGPRESEAGRRRRLIRRFRRAPLGPYDVELQAFLLPLRNLPAKGKHALMRIAGEAAWTLVRLGDREHGVEVLGGRWTSLAEAEWAVFRARWMAVHGQDPEADDD